MSRPAAWLFSWVQSAGFYRDAHREAVELLPRGAGRTWLDVGCGPGLVAALAADRGYDATGIDRDAAMIHAARRRFGGPACRFAVASVGDLSTLPTADVVSAASLLCALPDPRVGFERLWQQVREGGSLLVIETTASMTRSHVRESSIRPHPALVLWATARQGRVVDPVVYDLAAGALQQTVPLLDGMLTATIITKPDASGREAVHPCRQSS